MSLFGLLLLIALSFTCWFWIVACFGLLVGRLFISVVMCDLRIVGLLRVWGLLVGLLAGFTIYLACVWAFGYLLVA